MLSGAGGDWGRPTGPQGEASAAPGPARPGRRRPVLVVERRPVAPPVPACPRARAARSLAWPAQSPQERKSLASCNLRNQLAFLTVRWGPTPSAWPALALARAD